MNGPLEKNTCHWAGSELLSRVNNETESKLAYVWKKTGNSSSLCYKRVGPPDYLWLVSLVLGSSDGSCPTELLNSHLLEQENNSSKVPWNPTSKNLGGHCVWTFEYAKGIMLYYLQHRRRKTRCRDPTFSENLYHRCSKWLEAGESTYNVSEQVLYPTIK